MLSKTPLEVSIHAPVMDANTDSRCTSDGDDSFNPRARDGREVRNHADGIRVKQFQSTRP